MLAGLVRVLPLSLTASRLLGCESYSFSLPNARRRIVLIMKLQTDAVDTMSLIGRRRITLSLKNMPQVPATVRADDLSTLHTKCAVCMSRHSARNAVKVRWPAAARLKLVVGLVQRSLAAGAGVDAGCGRMLIVLACEGGFGAFFSEDAELFWARNVSIYSHSSFDRDTNLYSKLPATRRLSVRLGTTSFLRRMC